jgi:hypothetical protein
MAEPRESSGRGAERRPGSPVPDGVLLGGIVVLVMVPVSVWCAAELGGRLTHGHWPDLTLTAAALSIRHLVTHPDAVAAAWPRDTRAGLPGAAVFWGVWAGIVLVTVTVAGMVVYRVVRRRAIRRAERDAVEDYLASRRFSSARANRDLDD